MQKMYLYFFLMSLHICAMAYSPDSALQLLIDGNQRFMTAQSTHRDLAKEELVKFKSGQQPFAVVVGCSDSRVPLEIIFDQGVGSIFAIRDAGNVIGPIELDSIKFAILKLGVPLILVLGHQNCGAVNAVMTGQANGSEFANIYSLIAPALQLCKKEKGDPLTNAIKCNVRQAVAFLKSQPDLQKLMEQNQLKIVGGYYDFEHGQVSLIDR
jgi:carbonic anhydrase